MKQLADMIRVCSGLVSIVMGSGFFADGIDHHSMILILTGVVVMVTGGINALVVSKDYKHSSDKPMCSK